MSTSTEAPETGTADQLDLGDLPAEAGTVEAERAARKRDLAVALRLFARYGFDEGIAGHLTVRDPEFPDRFWVNPYAVHFSRIKVSDLLLIDENGKVAEGSRRTNKAAFWIHSSVHRARPDVVAVAHAHSVYGRAFAALGKVLAPIIQESCAFYGDHVLFDEYQGLVLEKTEGERIATRLGGQRAAILRHHGLLTVGRSVAEAAWWFIAMDRACHMQLLADAAGTPRVMTDEEATLAHRQFGSATMARHSFNIMADVVVETEPDVLD
ncbi:class II aldolase/adducin family protein [Amycolatopsis sp. NPDC005232]|uniref:class II aldolase/adducin family protein n=1 Tax=Amycolatopsis sp. NPDC005232 TaxID=3157027 RepID=UPI00339EDBB8